MFRGSESLHTPCSLFCVSEALNHSLCCGSQQLLLCFMHGGLCNNRGTSFSLCQLESLFQVHYIMCYCLQPCGTLCAQKHCTIIQAHGSFLEVSLCHPPNHPLVSDFSIVLIALKSQSLLENSLPGTSGLL